MRPRIFILLLHMLLMLYSALDDVQEISIATHTRDDAGSPCDLHITLWFNFRVYQYTLSHPQSNITYTNSQESMQSTDDPSCRKAQMMLQCNNTNAAIIDRISFTTLSGQWYGISQFCIPVSMEKAGKFLLTDSECPLNYQHFESLCIDNEFEGNGVNNCPPPKQIVYFETLKPNQSITTGAWSDATDITIETDTCSPTEFPTMTPSQHTQSHTDHTSTFEPTTNPSVVPSKNPFIFPSAKTRELSTFISPDASYDTTITESAETSMNSIVFTDDSDVSNTTHRPNYAVIIATVVVGILISICLCFILYKQKQKRSIAKSAVHKISSVSISPVGHHINRLKENGHQKYVVAVDDSPVNPTLQYDSAKVPGVVNEVSLVDREGTVTVEGITDEQDVHEVYSKCFECGATSVQGVEGVFICALCKSFDDEKENDNEKMYENRNVEQETTEYGATNETAGTVNTTNM